METPRKRRKPTAPVTYWSPPPGAAEWLWLVLEQGMEDGNARAVKRLAGFASPEERDSYEARWGRADRESELVTRVLSAVGEERADLVLEWLSTGKRPVP